ncbi:AAA family ATPase [uncultured Bacteroides sp.]|uniref:AAA family ATPase n=1 Tax=uncultured Bacteroides sp. TaxID=162156 RepID=UPI002AAC4AEA|nr:AAA family ATPase [uncultured Bacteroides sp.]
MKILAIRGRNLASLEGDFEIDFTKEPLRSAGIFAITGSTGSGKSTLLDALCLALFDTTPRLSGVSSNSNIQDNKNDTITLKDSRNILRRGAVEGMAEVDFVSLSGDHYRSTWSVGRAGSKFSGRLRNVAITLLNLTTNVQEQGTKTELMKQIVSLIGLTFDQFTRSVLLAQGDFATFLKAKQGEKAELLEKLTGTDIYSRISQSIYLKNKLAEGELNTLKDQIKGIELLTDEQLEALELERKQITDGSVSVKKDSEELNLKIGWIKQEQELKREVALAETQLTEAKTAIDGAKPRYEYVARVDEVQEIRDVYNEQQTSLKQCTAYKNGLQAKQLEEKKNAELLAAAVEKLKACQVNQQQVNEAFEKVEPEILRARNLDATLEVVKRNGVQAKKEFDASEAFRMKVDANITNTTKQIEQECVKLNELNKWFEVQSIYKELVPRTELIVNLLNIAQIAFKQSANSERILKSRKEVLEGDKLKQEAVKKEAERLDKLLPAEILALRAKLSDGVPCPVCGSLHHPFYAKGVSSEKNLEEEELNRAKEAVKKQLESLNASIEESNKEITRLTTMVESYTLQYKDAFADAESYLAVLPSWKAEFEQGVLQAKLQKVATEWNNNLETLTLVREKSINQQTTLVAEKKNLEEAAKSLAEKEMKLKEYRGEYNDLLSERKKLLGGKPADEVAGIFQKEKKVVEEELRKLTEEQNKLIANSESLKGAIKETSATIARLDERSRQLEKSIEEWIAAKNGTIAQEVLSELLQKDSAWLIAEKKELDVLKKNEITIRATLDERHKRLALHQSAEVRTRGEEETIEKLQIQLQEVTGQLESMMKRNGEIDAIFAAYKAGKEKVKKFEKELPVKESLSQNWNKLNSLFGSATGSKFKEIAQGYTLDVLLTYANKQLQELSKRYELKRIPDTLGLEVIDLDMLGETRSVHTLSGGESFLVSLALALGLSSLSSNRMKVESLFIDEGFGSLDADTLRVAMDALERLQTQGRKIGVISHVSEMNEHIATQVRVEKTVNGRSRIEVVG